MDLSWDVTSPGPIHHSTPMAKPGLRKRPAAMDANLPKKTKRRPPSPTPATTIRPALPHVAFARSMHAPLPKVLRCGSMCSGMLSEYWALDGLTGKTAKHVFAVEKEGYARKFIAMNTNVQELFDDVQSEEFHAAVPEHDVLFAGFPCQGLSQAGLKLGADDPRTMLYMDVLRVAEKCKPRIVIIENVRGLISSHHAVFLDIIGRLNAMKVNSKKLYKVFSKVLDSREHGLAQRRIRVFIVAIALCGRPFDSVTLPWPEPEPAVGLDKFWDHDSTCLSSYLYYPLPSTQVAAANLKQMLKLVKRWAKKDGTVPTSYPIIVDIGSSTLNYGLDVCPTLTKSRTSARDYWSLQHGRKLSIMEFARLQGHDASKFKSDCTPTQMGALIGNGFSVPVMRKVIGAAVRAAEC